MAMMERAMSLFSPFHQPEGREPPHATASGAAGQAVEEELATLRAEIDSLRAKLAASEPAPVAPTPLHPIPRKAAK
jgi:polyhydroxyalkanoate synthesis regulator protein